MNHNPPKAGRREFALVLLGYILLIAVGYLPVVFLGRTLDPAVYVDVGTTQAPSVLPGRRPVPTADVDMGTPSLYEWPINRLVGRMWLAGEVPLWNPYQGMGAPLAAQYSSRAFFPYQIIEDICPVRWSDLFLLGRILLAALFTWLFLFRAGASRQAAFLGGALYAFSGTWSWLGNLEQMANVALMLPILLWAVEELGNALRPRNVALVGMAIGLTLLAGQPETALYVLTLAGVRALHKLWPDRLNRAYTVRRLLAFAGAALIGFLLSLPLLLIFSEDMRQAFHLHHPGGTMGVQSGTPWHLLAAIWTPEFYSHPVPSVHWPDNGDWDYLGGFSGVLPWILVVGGLARSRFRGAMGFFAGATFFILLKDLGIWPATWLGRLPFFDQAWTPRWAGPVWTFSLAAAAAFAADILLRPGEKAAPFRRKMIAGVIFLLFFFYAYGRHLFPPPYSLSPAALSNLPKYGPLQESGEWIRDTLGCAVTLITAVAALLVLRGAWLPRSKMAALLALALGELWFALPRSYSAVWSAAPLLLFLCGLVVAWSLLRQRWWLAAGFAGAGVLSLAVVDLVSPNGLPMRNDAYQETPGLSFLRAHVGYDRIMAIGGVLPPNAASALGLQDVRYIYALAPELMQRYSSGLLSPPRLYNNQLWLTGMDEYLGSSLLKALPRLWRSYSLAGVRYLIVPGGTPVWPGLVKVYDAEVTIYENPDRIARARIVHKIVQAKTVNEIYAHLSNASEDPTTFTVFSGEAAPINLLSTNVAPHSQATIISYAAKRVVVSADTDQAGILVLTDVYDPNWVVTVDGRPGQLIPADLTFRAVPLAPGHHQVVFTYAPASFSKGLFAAAAGLLICLALCLTDFLLRRAGAVKLEAGI